MISEAWQDTARNLREPLEADIITISHSRYLEEQQGDAAGHLEHLLATREQEMRALLAEKESLYSQNRQTWSLLEERTQENNQLQVENIELHDHFWEHFRISKRNCCQRDILKHALSSKL